VKRLWRRFWEIKEELGWKRLILRTGGVGTLLVILYVGFLWFTLPVVNDQTILRASQSTAIVDRNGTELYRVYGEQNRTIVKKEDISQHVKDAVVAIEDQRFFTRGCLDVRAIVRSLVTAGRKGGASTLTRHVVPDRFKKGLLCGIPNNPGADLSLPLYRSKHNRFVIHLVLPVPPSSDPSFVGFHLPAQQSRFLLHE
jgi:hypothetical protein